MGALQQSPRCATAQAERRRLLIEGNETSIQQRFSQLSNLGTLPCLHGHDVCCEDSTNDWRLTDISRDVGDGCFWGDDCFCFAHWSAHGTPRAISCADIDYVSVTKITKPKKAVNT
jgi:hypothetical protein